MKTSAYLLLWLALAGLSGALRADEGADGPKDENGAVNEKVCPHKKHCWKFAKKHHKEAGKQNGEDGEKAHGKGQEKSQEDGDQGKGKKHHKGKCHHKKAKKQDNQ